MSTAGEPGSDPALKGLGEELRSGRIGRREFVRRATAIGIAPSLLAATLAACGGERESSTGAGTGAGTTPDIGAGTAGSDSSAVPGVPYEGGTRGGTLSVAFADEGPSWDPSTTFDGVVYLGGAQLMWRNLVTYDENLKPEFDLAETMEYSSDAKTLNIKLKQGVSFHDGSELTAADVAATLNRALDPDVGSWGAGYLASIDGAADRSAGKRKDVPGIKTNGTHELTLTLATPDVALLSALAACPFAILPAKSIEGVAKPDFPNIPGTGPFKLESVDSSKLVVSRFDDYIYSEHVPYVDSVEWRWANASETSVLQIQRGELDMTGNTIAAATRLQLEKDEKFKEQLYTTLVPALPAFFFNLEQKPFDDVRVRQAFNYAFDAERAKRFALEPTGHYFFPGLLGYDDSLQTYEYDPERAKSLLKEAGQENLTFEFPFFAGEIGSSDGIIAENVLPLFQQDLEQVGVTLKIKRIAGDAQDNYDNYGDYAMWVNSYVLGFADPSDVTDSTLVTGGYNNLGGYSNPDVDKLAKDGKAQPDEAQRAETYAEIEKLVLQDAPMVVIGAFTNTIFHAPGMKNVYWNGISGLQTQVVSKS